MKIKILVFLFCVSTLQVVAQSWESIKSNPNYLSGEGWGASLAEADKAALAALLSNISVTVSHEFVVTEEETDNSAGFNTSSYVDSKIRTYTQGTLNNTKQFIISNEPDAHVFRYVKKEEVNKIFDARRLKVLDYVASAVKSEEKGKIDNALRYYYWGYMLLKSLQNPVMVTYTDTDGVERLLINWIPEQMNAIFDDMRVEVTRVSGSDIDLFFTFRGKPVSNVDYTYFDGASWSAIYSARDGRGTLELRPGASVENLHLKYEFEYRGEAQLDKEVQSVVDVVKGVPMRKSYVNVSCKGATMAQSAAVTHQQIAQQKELPTNTHQSVQEHCADNSMLSSDAALTPLANADVYQRVVDQVVKSILNRTYTGAENCFTPEALAIYKKLISYGKARLVGDTKCSFYQCGSDVVGRSVPMSFSFSNGARKSFVEQVVFTFDPKTKLISNLSFGLGEQAEQDILKKKEWPESSRTMLMNFLENYKTAYSLMRLDYIKDIFSDDAIIVTGKVTTRMERVDTGDGQSKWKNNRYVQLTRQSKNEYMTNLERCFKVNKAANGYVNIRFADNEVMRLGKGGEVYGIQIRQDYYSTYYADTGYLFLMVDMNNPEKPMIEVRSWQPEKDPNFGVIGPGHF